jgi:hypothetical protein
MDLNVTALVGILWEPEGLRLGEGVVVCGVEVDMDTVEFFNDMGMVKDARFLKPLFPDFSVPRMSPVSFQRSSYAV